MHLIFKKELPTIVWRWTGQSGAILNSLLFSLFVVVKTSPGKLHPAPQTYVICARTEMLDYNIFKPIRNFGTLILAFGVAGLFCLVAFFNNPDFFIEAKIFVFAISAFNLFIGYNIVTRNRFGYKSLRIYLYLIYPGYPLGYFYAKKAFEYIETNRIERFFNKSLKI